MKVTLGRTIQPRQFESARFEVELTNEDVDLSHIEDTGERIDTLHLEALRRILTWEVIQGSKTSEEAKSELARFRAARGLPPNGNGHGAQESSAG